MFSSDTYIFPASAIESSALTQAPCTSDVKVIGPGSGSTNRVYQRMRAWAPVTTSVSTPLAVLCRDWVPGQMSSECDLLDSPAGLELLTPEIVALGVASRDEYRATLDDGSTGGVYALPGVIRPRAVGLRLTSAASCDPEVFQTCTVDTRLFLCFSAIWDQ